MEEGAQHSGMVPRENRSTCLSIVTREVAGSCSEWIERVDVAEGEQQCPSWSREETDLYFWRHPTA